MAQPDDLTLGADAPEFNLPGVDGRRWGIGDIRGPRGLLVVFICNHCPYVKSITHKLVRDGQALMDMGFGVVAINSNDAVTYPEDSFDKMVSFARDAGFPFPYLHDEDQAVARAYGAVCTPDFFGYNAFLELQYRGRLDASGASGQDAPSELVPAMERIALRGKGPVDQVPTMGCSIKWKKD